MDFGLVTIGLDGFSMVANHWSNDGMVTIHRSGLLLYHKLKFTHYFQDKEEGISSEMASKLPAPSRLVQPSKYES